MEWHKHILYAIRHPFFSHFDCKKSNVNHICISVFLSCFLCVIFSLSFPTTSRLVSMQNKTSPFCNCNHFVIYIFACTKSLTLFLSSRSFLLTAINQFIQMCVVHSKSQTSNTSLILKFRKLQFIKIRTTSSMHAILINSHMLCMCACRIFKVAKEIELKWRREMYSFRIFFGFHLLEVLIVSLKLHLLLYEKQRGKA